MVLVLRAITGQNYESKLDKLLKVTGRRRDSSFLRGLTELLILTGVQALVDYRENLENSLPYVSMG